MKYVIATVVGLIFLLRAPLLTAQEITALSQQQLKSLVSGNSMAGNGKVNQPAVPYDWIVFYGADGTMTIRLKPAWGSASDTGKWWITEKGELCRQFNKMASGKIGCWLYYQEDEFYRFVPSKGVAVEGRAAIIQGNLLEKQE